MRCVFVCGVSTTDQADANRRTPHNKIVNPTFYQKFILFLLTLIVMRNMTNMKGLEYIVELNDNANGLIKFLSKDLSN